MPLYLNLHDLLSILHCLLPLLREQIHRPPWRPLLLKNLPLRVFHLLGRAHRPALHLRLR